MRRWRDWGLTGSRPSSGWNDKGEPSTSFPFAFVFMPMRQNLQAGFRADLRRLLQRYWAAPISSWNWSWASPSPGSAIRKSPPPTSASSCSSLHESVTSGVGGQDVDNLDAGAREVWLCAESGAMRSFDSAGTPPMPASRICPEFPDQVQLRSLVRMSAMTLVSTRIMLRRESIATNSRCCPSPCRHAVMSPAPAGRAWVCLP